MIVALVLGLEVDQVTVQATSTTAGQVIFDSAMSYDPGSRGGLRRQVARDTIVALYAGFEAERLFDAAADPEESANDRRYADEVAVDYLGFPRHRELEDFQAALLERLRSRARSLVRRHRAAIEVLASALATQPTLTGTQARQILGRS